VAQGYKLTLNDFRLKKQGEGCCKSEMLESWQQQWKQRV